MNFEELYKKFYRELFCFAHQLTGCKQRSEDLVQEAFEKLFNEYNNGSDILNSRAWLYKVLLNLYKTTVSTEKRRAKKLHLLDSNEISGEDIHKQLLQLEKERIVTDTLKRLPGRDKDILLLYRRGLSYDEMAEVMDMNKSSVGTTLARAIEKLKNELKRKHHELFE